MNSFPIASLQLNAKDANGMLVQSVYARYEGHYAVYRTAERVCVQFSDVADLEGQQRERLAKLSPLRGQINGLVDGWRSARLHGFKSAALRYDRRVADSLILALEGETDTALQLLQQIRDDIVAERKSLARFKYLLYAGGTAGLLIWFAVLQRHNMLPTLGMLTPLFNSTDNTWLALAAGTLGAFFSIARGLSGRSIHTDLQMLDNAIDAVLRILIGAIAALVLQALLDANLFALHIGSSVLGAETRSIPAPDTIIPTRSLVLLVAAFVAGFSERLIPDLLDSATLAAADKRRAAAAEPAAKTDPSGSTAPKTTIPPAATTTATTTMLVPAAAAPDEPQLDGSDIGPSDTVAPTPDEALPAATGGVDKP